MKLSTTEFRAMQSLPRRLGQRFFELPVLQMMGMDVRNKDILEIGCGSGYGAFLIDRHQPKSYIGLDVMEEQVALARRKYPQFQFLVQDATDLKQFESSSKDVVIIFGVLHHIPDWRKVLDEIQRVLKPGGNLFLEEPRGIDVKFFDFFFHWGHPDSDFGLKVMEEYLKSYGFKFQRQWTPLLTMYHIKS